MLPENAWEKEYNSAITVCDRSGIIVFMNEKACRTFAGQGGAALVGKSLFDCHKPTSREKIKKLITSGKSNTYTIEKNGVKKLIHQAPWFIGGAIAGMVELSIEIPFEMPHFIRK